MTSPDQNNFYVNLLSTASRDIYDLNTHADFTVILAQPIDLGSTSKWEVEVCEISCSSSSEGANPVLLYCNLISPQFLGDSTVPQRHVSARVSERKIRATGAEQILTPEDLHIPYEDSIKPTKLVLHFRKNYQL